VFIPFLSAGHQCLRGIFFYPELFQVPFLPEVSQAFPQDSAVKIAVYFLNKSEERGCFYVMEKVFGDCGPNSAIGGQHISFTGSWRCRPSLPVLYAARQNPAENFAIAGYNKKRDICR